MARPKRDLPWTDTLGGVYYVCWYDGERRRTERLSLRTRDAVEAQDRFIAFLQEGRSVMRKPERTGLTITEVLDSYLREHVGMDPDTREPVAGAPGAADKYRQWLAARHLKTYFKDMPVSDLDIPATRRYTAHRSRCKPAAQPSTVRRELVALVAAIGHAVRWRRLDKAKAPEIELPPNAPVQDAKFLSKPELRAALALAAKDDDPRLHAFMVLAYGAGARRASIERLTKAQIDLDKTRMYLTPEGARRTKKRAPAVPLSLQMAMEVRKLLLWSGTSPWLFKAPGFDVYPKFRAVMEAVGATDRTGPHVLRHSRATHMLQDGATIWEVASLLGDTVDTVQRVYGHHCPDYMAGRGAFSGMGGVI